MVCLRSIRQGYPTNYTGYNKPWYFDSNLGNFCAGRQGSAQTADVDRVPWPAQTRECLDEQFDRSVLDQSIQQVPRIIQQKKNKKTNLWSIARYKENI